MLCELGANFVYISFGINNSKIHSISSSDSSTLQNLDLSCLMDLEFGFFWKGKIS